MPLLHPMPLHRAHDVDALLAVWQEIAARSDLIGETLGECCGWPVLGYRNAVPGPPYYLSAGVHGDEAAAAWGLAEWAWAHPAMLRSVPLILCPCLNPAGIAANTRLDHRGRDLNRMFHDSTDALIGSWQQWVSALRPRLGICLHEDYDAQGCYVYELSRGAPVPRCEPVMQVVERVMARDPNRSIEGRAASQGIIQRDEPPSDVIGPEAIVLWNYGCEMTLTFETPSEFALDARVLAHQTFIEAALEHFAA